MADDYLISARRLVELTPQASVPTTKYPFFRACYCDTDGDYEIAMPGNHGEWITIPLFAGMNPIQICAVHTGGPGTLWGVE